MPRRRDNIPSMPLPRLQAIFRDNPAALLNRVPGLYLVDKPEGASSHDIVAIARQRLQLRRVGHGGTLDPLATGLLILFVGNATRLFDELQTFTKTYEAHFRLGITTDTQDITGTVLTESEVPAFNEEKFEATLAPFRGEISQLPPMHSALKHKGKPLYEFARKGQTIERESRQVTVHNLVLNKLEGDEVDLTMTVSKGFYVRTLIDDLGKALGCGATMTALRRTRIGPFDVADAVAADDLTRGEFLEGMPEDQDNA